MHPLADTIGSLADVTLNHIGFEERTVLPLAREYLIASDWDEIAQAFCKIYDPRFGPTCAGHPTRGHLDRIWPPLPAERRFRGRLAMTVFG